MIDGSQLWKWVRYYTSNWRLLPSQIQAVRFTLAQCYWQGIISWNEFVRTERLLGKMTPNTVIDYPASDLALALSLLGKTIEGYRLVDVRGFLDQGILFQAQKGEEMSTLLCLTAPAIVPPDIHILSDQLIHVTSVITTPEHTYLELSPFEGTPLCVWLTSQHPTGLPAPLADLLLQQIYQLLLTLGTLDVLESIHPGQLFIDPDNLNLQLIPFIAEIKPYMRGQLYQGEPGYRLMAIAYELSTGCVPSAQYRLVEVLKACKTLSSWQKKQLAACLTGKRSVSLSQAALILDASKQYKKRDTALLALASVFALAAFTWQGMHYIPQWFAAKSANQEIPHQMIVIEHSSQNSKDSHVNLLKAAFFTQIQERNFAGARVSWQALQKILPHNDIFIEKVGPELLAQYQVDIDMPEPVVFAPIAPVIELEAVQMPTYVDSSVDIVALPPLPEVIETIPQNPNPQPLTEIIETVIMKDPCEGAKACIDTLSDAKWGPRLLATQSLQNQPLVITQQTISVLDYNQYCASSSHCTPYEQANSLDLELTEIENTVYDYNAYCLTTGLCDALDVPAQPVRALTPEQVKAYAAWLSQETGFVYRIPTVDEWQAVHTVLGNIEEHAQWLLNASGEWITTTDLAANSKKHRKISTDQIAFRLVREKRP